MPLELDKSDWKPVTFGEVVKEVRQSSKDPVADGIERVVGLEHIEPECIHLRTWASIEEETTFIKAFQKGHVLFGRRRAYLKKAAMAEFDGICSGDITVMEAKEDLLPELLPFLVCNDKFFDYAVQHSAGGLSPRTKFKDLANYEFLLPPKDQQAKLAELLWAADGALEKYSQLEGKVELAGDAVQATTIWPKSDSSEMLQPLRDHVDVVAGFAFKSGDFCSDGVQLVRMGNIFGKNLDLSRKPVFLPAGYADEYPKFVLNPGDIVLSLTGTMGKRDYGFSVQIPDGTPQLLLNQRAVKITPRVSLTKVYLLKVMSSEPFLRQLYRRATGTKQANLSIDQLLSIKIPVPSTEDQTTLSNEIHSYDRIKKQTELSSSRGKAFQKALINQIF